MNYNIRTDVRYGPLEVIDAGRLAETRPERWWNETLCRVNDCVVRLGVLDGEFHWHKHDREDEVFYVVEGRLLVDLRDRTVELEPRQGFLVPRGVVHRTRAPKRTVVLMIEAATVVPTGDGKAAPPAAKTARRRRPAPRRARPKGRAPSRR